MTLYRGNPRNLAKNYPNTKVIWAQILQKLINFTCTDNRQSKKKEWQGWGEGRGFPLTTATRKKIPSKLSVPQQHKNNLSTEGQTV